MENLNQLKITLADSNKMNKRLVEQPNKTPIAISKWLQIQQPTLRNM